MAHIIQARPDGGLDFQVQDFQTFEDVHCSLGKGRLLSKHVENLLRLRMRVSGFRFQVVGLPGIQVSGVESFGSVFRIWGFGSRA